MARPKPLSRPKRWAAAAQALSDATDKLEGVADDDLEALLEDVEGALQDLRDLRDEYQEWREGLPENLDASPVAEKLDAIVELDLDPDLSFDDEDDTLATLDGLRSLVGDVENADLPLGFGRD